MYVEQLKNKNQFIIYANDGIYFQSYKSLIAKIDNEYDLTLYKDWDYSKTTLKHLKMFLNDFEWNLKCLIDFYDKPFKKQIENSISKGYIIKGW